MAPIDASSHFIAVGSVSSLGSAQALAPRDVRAQTVLGLTDAAAGLSEWVRFRRASASSSADRRAMCHRTQITDH